MRTCDLLVDFLEEIGPSTPSCRNLIEVKKMSTRDTVWAIEPKSGSIIATHKHIKRKRFTNHSQLKLSYTSRVQRESALLRIRGLTHRVDRILVLLLHLCKLLLEASLVVCLGLCERFVIIFPVEEEEEEEGGGGRRRRKRSQKSQWEHYLTKLSLRLLLRRLPRPGACAPTGRSP